ncbi:hypothetical protein FIBSPDRAFT_905018 [Athelia psychrophila]|uniref:Uncharacterized protein n=1 Tax=Athelia psychrophila TaxID=1759441 RepID=A0A167TZK0_9AGAM|nr:hypothetical protein FIBSPDRAFT_905018 [Fibularhizoctonia sp. CBS 109695]
MAALLEAAGSTEYTEAKGIARKLNKKPLQDVAVRAPPYEHQEALNIQSTKALLLPKYLPEAKKEQAQVKVQVEERQVIRVTEVAAIRPGRRQSPTTAMFKHIQGLAEAQLGEILEVLLEKEPAKLVNAHTQGVLGHEEHMTYTIIGRRPDQHTEGPLKATAESAKRLKTTGGRGAHAPLELEPVLKQRAGIVIQQLQTIKGPLQEVQSIPRQAVIELKHVRPAKRPYCSVNKCEGWSQSDHKAGPPGRGRGNNAGSTNQRGEKTSEDDTCQPAKNPAGYRHSQTISEGRYIVRDKREELSRGTIQDGPFADSASTTAARGPTTCATYRHTGATGASRRSGDAGKDTPGTAQRLQLGPKNICIIQGEEPQPMQEATRNPNRTSAQSPPSFTKTVDQSPKKAEAQQVEGGREQDAAEHKLKQHVEQNAKERKERARVRKANYIVQREKETRQKAEKPALEEVQLEGSQSGDVDGGQEDAKDCHVHGSRQAHKAAQAYIVKVTQEQKQMVHHELLQGTQGGQVEVVHEVRPVPCPQSHHPEGRVARVVDERTRKAALHELSMGLEDRELCETAETEETSALEGPSVRAKSVVVEATLAEVGQAERTREATVFVLEPGEAGPKEVADKDAVTGGAKEPEEHPVAVVTRAAIGKVARAEKALAGGERAPYGLSSPAVKSTAPAAQSQSAAEEAASTSATGTGRGEGGGNGEASEGGDTALVVTLTELVVAADCSGTGATRGATDSSCSRASRSGDGGGFRRGTETTDFKAPGPRPTASTEFSSQATRNEIHDGGEAIVQGEERSARATGGTALLRSGSAQDALRRRDLVCTHR